MEMRKRIEQETEEALRHIDAVIEAKRPDQSMNRYLSSVKLIKELYTCALTIKDMGCPSSGFSNDEACLNEDSCANVNEKNGGEAGRDLSGNTQVNQN